MDLFGSITPNVYKILSTNVTEEFTLGLSNV